MNLYPPNQGPAQPSLEELKLAAAEQAKVPKEPRLAPQYWSTARDSFGTVYSCDMVRYNFQLRTMDQLEPLTAKIQLHPQQVTSSFSLAEWRFRYLWTIAYGTSTATVALNLNGGPRENRLKGFVEFNPNKCMPAVQKDLEWLFLQARTVSLARLDVALDTPHPRSTVHLVKDSRLYQKAYNSLEDCTEYLGQRSHPGFVKVYNKQLEDGLAAPLTRVEVTCTSAEDFKDHWPAVRFDGARQLQLELDQDLTSTQLALIQALQKLPDGDQQEALSLLQFRMRKKIECHLYGTGDTLQADFSLVSKIVSPWLYLVKDTVGTKISQ